ncbi:MAG: cupin domain-containing protein [Deltaproteobacteria bacterium]|nr:cupin domain-containing protein [Deltaproteobacteria bacterium]
MEATSTVQVDNERVLVTHWRLAPGANTGFHVHERDYVVIPLTTGVLRLEEPGGVVREVPLEAGASYAKQAGVSHNTFNGGEQEFSFVEVELK